MMNHIKSEEFFHRAQHVLVGGVNSPVRSFKGVGKNALVMNKALRSKLYDYDGNAYTDFCLSWGASILGHAHRNVVLATKKAAEKGLSFGTTTRDEIFLAEHIVQRVPSIEQIRFVNSGTEATMSAIRLARGFTKRDKIIKFNGCYHGHSDDLLASAGSGVSFLAESSSEGVPKEHVSNTLSLPYNDIEKLKEAFQAHPKQIACVIIEPVAGNMGVIQADKDFLKELRLLTQTSGTVLIFDEIMSGFRTHVGCAQSDLGVIPDMTCLGKIIGGGFPIGAYGGRKEIMQCLAPLGGVYQAGTFSGTPVIMKAGLAALKLLDERFYHKLNQTADNLANELNDCFKQNDLDLHLSHYGSMLSLRFRQEPVRNYQEAQQAAGHERYGRLFWHLIDCGFYLPPADLEAFFISIMHTKQELKDFKEAIKNYFLNEKNL